MSVTYRESETLSILPSLYNDEWFIFSPLKILKNLTETLKFLMPFLPIILVSCVLFLLEVRVLKKGQVYGNPIIHLFKIKITS